ncbi:MAG: tetratricopeptide repeat protein [Terriglobia bacterium]
MGARRGVMCALLLALFVFSAAAAADQIGSAPKPPPALEQYRAGLAALQKGDVAAAETDFQESLRLDPKQPAPYLALAEIALRKRQLQQAQRFLEQALAVAPGYAQVQAAWGAYLFHAAKQYTRAAQAFATAAKLDPRSVPYQVELGDVYMEGLHQPHLAIEHYQAAIHIDPRNPAARFALANALAATGNLKGAEAEYGKASQLAPRSPLPHMALGDAYAAQGDHPGALKEYNTALQLSPKLAAAYLKIGMIDELDQRANSAMRAYQTAVSLDPKMAVAYNNLAFLAVEQKVDADQALSWAQKAAQLAPKSPQVLDTLGWVYHSRNETSQALAALKQASALAPRDPQILYHLGVVYTSAQQSQQAAAAFNKALALKINFPEMGDARSRLAALNPSR